MTGRDDWARLTPYELGLPGREFAEEGFRAIRDEAKGRGVDPADPGGFLVLEEVGRILTEIRGRDEGGDEALHRFGPFLFHALHFQAAGEPVFLLEIAAARYLVEGTPVPEAWRGELPEPAGYLQLPRHLFWGSPDPEGPAEPLDGIFWARSSGETLSLLAVFGMRRDRPGMSVVPLPPLPLADARSWISEPAREGGEDFATTLPGGELDRLYSVETQGEVLKLAARTLGYAASVPGAVGEEERAPRAEELPEDHRDPLPSLLPFRRVRLVS